MDPVKSETETLSHPIIRTIFNSLSAHIAIIDENGDILETNSAWKKFSEENGGSQEIGPIVQNYLHVCEVSSKQGDPDAKAVEMGIRDVIAQKTDEFLYDYPCHSPEGQRWFYMRAVLMADENPVKVIISHEDITQLKLIEEELKEKNVSLEEANIALKVLIRQRETDKSDMETKFLSNLKTTVLPYIQKLKEADLKSREKTLVTILDDHLKDIISPLMQNLSNANVMLTPQEIQVASLVKDGRTTSDIADVLFVSEATVSFHRKNIREKLGIKNKGTNLRSFLMAMSK